MDAAEIKERIRSGYEAFGRGDFDTAIEMFSDDFELVRPSDLGVIRGRDAVREFYEPDAFVDMVFEVRSIEINGDRALVVATVSARGRYSGIPVTQESFQVWWLRGEHVVRGETFIEERAAREAAGLG